jgi:hypothetical protein
MSSPHDIVYAPADRPLCEVYDDWTYYPGEVRAWFWRHGWFANVSWTTKPGYTYIRTKPASFIRGVEPPATPEEAAS